MGAVFEATDLRHDRKVAVKQLHLKYVGDGMAVQRFQREAKLTASMGHENICEVTDQGTADDGSPYLVMPLLTGSSLAEILKREVRLTVPRTVGIVSQVLAALEAAHRSHIVHRDLKPGNIFVESNDDGREQTRLLDFGISKVLDQDIISELTASGVVLGTPYYMAPEQATGSRDIDHRVDLYAIGVILYEALTGRKPFPGDSYNEVMFKIVSNPFPAPTSLVPSLPRALEIVILRAMSRHPNERFQNAAEMRINLERAAAEGTTTKARTFVTNSTASMDEVTPFTAVESAKSSPPRRARRAIWIGLAAAFLVALTGAVGFSMRGDEKEASPDATSGLSTQDVSAPASPYREDEQQPPPPQIEPDPPTMPSAPKSEPASESEPAPESEPASESEPAPEPIPEVLKSEIERGDKLKKRAFTKRNSREKSVSNKRTEKVTKEPGAKKEDTMGKEQSTVKGRFGTKIVSDF